MSKYDSLKFLKSTSAKIVKKCNICGEMIVPGDTYYLEKLLDSRINFIGKKFCKECVGRFKKQLPPIKN